jgi:hypothetical protein
LRICAGVEHDPGKACPLIRGGRFLEDRCQPRLQMHVSQLLLARDLQTDAYTVQNDRAVLELCAAVRGVLEDECECQAIEEVCCCLHPRPPICPECHGHTRSMGVSRERHRGEFQCCASARLNRHAKHGVVNSRGDGYFRVTTARNVSASCSAFSAALVNSISA